MHPVPHVVKSGNIFVSDGGKVFSAVRVIRCFILYVMFCKSLFVLLSLFLLAIVLSALRFTDSDCPFGIFKLFFLYKTESRLK